MKNMKTVNIKKMKKEWIKPKISIIDINKTENGDTADTSEGVWFFLPGSS